MKTNHNVGGWDRNVRYTLGFLFPVLALFFKGNRWARTLMWIIGLDGLLTAYFQYSPLNRLFGFSSVPKRTLLSFRLAK